MKQSKAYVAGATIAHCVIIAAVVAINVAWIYGLVKVIKWAWGA